MTKYVLNSGGIWKHPALAQRFFTEVVNGLGPTPRMLVCSFAQPREDWEEKFATDSAILDAVPPGVEVSLELAMPDTFVEQMTECDALCIHGGDDHLLQYWLTQFNLPGLWEGKVVATSSASSNALSTHYWTCDWREVGDGLGIVPVKFIPHFQSEYGSTDPRGPIDWDAAHRALTTYGDTSLPIHALPEGEFIVIEQ